MEAQYTILVETPATRVSKDRGRERAQLLHPFHSRQSGSRGRGSHADSKDLAARCAVSCARMRPMPSLESTRPALPDASESPALGAIGLLARFVY